jgi:hypothetical protein
MSTYDLLEAYVNKRTSKLTSFPDIVQKGINTIAGEIPFKLKLAITLSELITFSSHLRKPIMLFDGTLVPTNAIVFALSGSGDGKDKMLNAIRKSLQQGYDELENGRNDYARARAEKLAILEGEGPEHWQKYYIAPKPLQAGLGTVEGLMHHFAEIAENPMGAGSIMTSEIGTELQTNGSIVDIIKAVAVAYDLGNIPAKIVKSHENQTKSVKALPVNALFFGSQEAILFNNDIKAKFKLVFTTQLARRGIFMYTPEPPTRISIKSIDDLYTQKKAERERVLNAQEVLKNLTSDLVSQTNQEPLTITDDAEKLFDVYLEYNALLSDSMSNKLPISKLSRKHKQWLALKLAGSYAILENKDCINEQTYAYAINTVELMSQNLSDFEVELVKEPYEQLVKMCKFKEQDGEFVVSLHELRKLSYISGSGSSKSKVDEIIALANSYDNKGKYSAHEGGIKYEEVIPTDVVGVSWKPFDTNLTGKALKDFMVRNSDDGFEFLETTFDEIELLLEMNAVYSSFAFTDGKRSKANLFGGTKFIVLDVDKSFITDIEVHTLLNDYNHYVVRTSDIDNQYKFRVLLELDAVVTIDEQLWKDFVAEVGIELGLVVDILPQSQIYLSFKSRNVMTQLEGKTLKTKYLLDAATNRRKTRPKPARELPSKEKLASLKDPRETFNYAFTVEKGERSITMYKCLAHAIDLGADEEYIRNLADEVNAYWVDSLDEDRLKRTLVTPALRRIL